MTGKHRKPSRLRRVARTAAPLAVIAGLGAAPTAAGAQPLPNLGPAPQAPNRADIDGFLDRAQIPGEVRDAVEPFLPKAEPQPAPAPAPAPAPQGPAPIKIHPNLPVVPQAPIPLNPFG